MKGRRRSVVRRLGLRFGEFSGARAELVVARFGTDWAAVGRSGKETVGESGLESVDGAAISPGSCVAVPSPVVDEPVDDLRGIKYAKNRMASVGSNRPASDLEVTDREAAALTRLT